MMLFSRAIVQATANPYLIQPVDRCRTGQRCGHRDRWARLCPGSRRSQYGAVKILHGVKTPDDLLYRERFDAWRRQPDTQVLLTSDQPDKAWRCHVGVVTELFEQVEVDSARTVVLMCGPDIMMRMGVPILMQPGIPATVIYVSILRRLGGL